MVETVIDSRVAQLEAALAEISRREQGHLRSLDDALTKLHSTRKDVVGLRAQVATLHQEQARKQATIDELIADWSDTQDQWRDLEARLIRERDEALEDAQYQPEFWAVLRIVTRERDEAQAELAACQRDFDTLTRNFNAQERQLDECRAEQVEMKEWGQQLVVAERQLAESIGKRLQLEDQIAAVRAYCDERVREQKFNYHHHIRNTAAHVLALLPASPPETARPAEAIMFSVVPLFPDEDCEEPPTGEDLYLKARGLSLLVTAERGSQGAYCLLVDGTVHKSGTFGLEPLPASPTPTKEPRSEAQRERIAQKIEMLREANDVSRHICGYCGRSSFTHIIGCPNWSPPRLKGVK